VASLACLALAVPALPAAAEPAAAGQPVQVTTPNPVRAAVDANAPVITGFSAPGADVGTEITVRGSGFVPDVAGNAVSINGVAATVTAASATSITFLVPQNTGSGYVSVTTADGTGISPDHLVIPPRGMTVADIYSTGLVRVDAPDVIASIGAARQVSLLRFDGHAGQQFAFGFAKPTLNSLSRVTFYGPDGSVLRLPDGNGALYSVSRYGGQILLPPLTIDGPIAMVIDPQTDTATGTVNVSAPAIVDGGEITTTGDPVGLTFTKPYQQISHTFTATAGQELSFAHHDWKISGFGETYLAVHGPDHRRVTYMVTGSTSRVLTFTAPVTGQYKLFAVMDNVSGGSPTGSYRLTMSETADSGTIEVGGAAKQLTLTRYGRQQRIRFTGKAGQRLGFGVTDVKNAVYAPSMSVVAPDGVKRWDLFSAWENEITEPLPADGEYTITLNPFATSGTYSLWLSEDVAGGVLTPDAAPAQIQVPRPGQNVRFTIPGTAGQRLGLAMLHSWNFGLVGILTSPGGGELLNRGARNNLDLPALPVDGDYEFLADLGAVSGTATFVLSNDLRVGSVAVGGEALAVGISRPGQNARGTFEGLAGQRIGLGLSENVIPGQYRLRVFGPTGSEVPGAFLDVQSGTRDDKEVLLPANGTYEFVLDPSDDNTNVGGLKVLATEIHNAGAVTIGGAQAALSMPRLGQDGTFTFTGTSGQRLALTFADNTLANGMTNGSYFNVTVLGPNGRPLSGLDYKLKTDMANLAIPALTATGTYTVLIDPERGGTGGIKSGVIATA
jgi:hypothetical protein